jgi:hypothetical protein
MHTHESRLTSERIDRLADAHTRTVDARAGFATMVQKAEPRFRGIAQRFHDFHDSHASELAAILEAQGRTPDGDGSFMSSVNTLVVSARAFLDEIGEDVMDQVRDGEKHVLKALDDARADMDNATVQKAVARMKAELTALLEDTRHLG